MAPIGTDRAGCRAGFTPPATVGRANGGVNPALRLDAPLARVVGGEWRNKFRPTLAYGGPKGAL